MARRRRGIGASVAAIHNAFIAPVATVAYLDEDSSTTPGTEFTFSSMGIGSADSNRTVFAFITTRRGSTAGVSVTNLTIGGVTALLIDSHTDVSVTATNYIGLWMAVVPTGTTADVVATISDAVARCGCILYGTSDSFNATPIDTTKVDPGDGISPQVMTLNIDVLNGGFSLACCLHAQSAATGSYSWSGMTEDADLNYGANTHSSASYNSTANESPRTVSATATSTGVPLGTTGLALSFRAA